MAILTQGERVELQGLEAGVAMCATGMEGGNRTNSWFLRATRGLICDDTTPYVACEFMSRYRDDVAQIVRLQCERVRLGVEWARIEPEEGKFDESALRAYGEMLDAFKEAGISVLVDLHHFSHPVWLENAGGFVAPGAPAAYARYVRKTAQALVGKCEGFVTFDSPNLMIYETYVTGKWNLRGKRKKRHAYKAMSNVAAAHLSAYRILHEEAKKQGVPTKVGAFFAFRHLRSKYSSGLLAAINLARKENLYGRGMDDAMLRGQFFPPLKKPKATPWLSAERDDTFSREGLYADFVGVRYCGRVVVQGNTEESKAGAPIDDANRDIYNKGVARAVKAFARFDLPVYFTDGIADKADAFRARFIAEQVKQLAASGARRYYYDSYCDSFVFDKGIRYKYGLFETDFATQERKPRESAAFFTALIRDKGFTAEEALLQEEYPLFAFTAQ